MLSEDALAYDEQIEIEPPRTLQPADSNNNQLDKGSKIIKTGHMSFEVIDLHQVKHSVDSILAIHKGYYETETFHKYSHNSSYKLKVRVPFNDYNNFLKALESGAGKLISKNLKADDVTEQYVDLTIRRDNALAYIQRYNELLKKAQTIKEILNIQDEIRRLEEEVESKTGRIKYMDDKVRYSTLDIELTEKTTVVLAEVKYGTKMLAAFRSGFNTGSELLLVLIRLWPLLIFILIMYLGRYRLKNVLKKQKIK